MQEKDGGDRRSISMEKSDKIDLNNATIQVCEGCTKSKVKCDRNYPTCGRCYRLSIPCIKRYKIKQLKPKIKAVSPAQPSHQPSPAPLSPAPAYSRAVIMPPIPPSATPSTPSSNAYTPFFMAKQEREDQYGKGEGAPIMDQQHYQQQQQPHHPPSATLCIQPDSTAPPRKFVNHFLVHFYMHSRDFNFIPPHVSEEERKPDDHMSYPRKKRLELLLGKWAATSHYFGTDYTWGVLSVVEQVMGRCIKLPTIGPMEKAPTEVYIICSGLNNRTDIPPIILEMDDGVTPLAIVIGCRRAVTMDIHVNQAFENMFATAQELNILLNEFRCLPLFAMGKFVVDEDMTDYAEAVFTAGFLGEDGFNSAETILKMKDRDGNERLCLLRLRFSYLIENSTGYLSVSIMPLSRSPHLIADLPRHATNQITTKNDTPITSSSSSSSIGSTTSSASSSSPSPFFRVPEYMQGPPPASAAAIPFSSSSSSSGHHVLPSRSAYGRPPLPASASSTSQWHDHPPVYIRDLQVASQQSDEHQQYRQHEEQDQRHQWQQQQEQQEEEGQHQQQQQEEEDGGQLPFQQQAQHIQPHLTQQQHGQLPFQQQAQHIQQQFTQQHHQLPQRQLPFQQQQPHYVQHLLQQQQALPAPRPLMRASSEGEGSNPGGRGARGGGSGFPSFPRSRSAGLLPSFASYFGFPSSSTANNINRSMGGMITSTTSSSAVAVAMAAKPPSSSMMMASIPSPFRMTARIPFEGGGLRRSASGGPASFDSTSRGSLGDKGGPPTYRGQMVSLTSSSNNQSCNGAIELVPPSFSSFPLSDQQPQQREQQQQPQQSEQHQQQQGEIGGQDYLSFRWENEEDTHPRSLCTASASFSPSLLSSSMPIDEGTKSIGGGSLNGGEGGAAGGCEGGLMHWGDDYDDDDSSINSLRGYGPQQQQQQQGQQHHQQKQFHQQQQRRGPWPLMSFLHPTFNTTITTTTTTSASSSATAIETSMLHPCPPSSSLNEGRLSPFSLQAQSISSRPPHQQPQQQGCSSPFPLMEIMDDFLVGQE